MLLHRPPPGIEAHPLETNLLEWHFLLRPTQPPYQGGEYHGVLTFPPEYPMLPPSFKVLTPSGNSPCRQKALGAASRHHTDFEAALAMQALMQGSGI